MAGIWRSAVHDAFEAAVLGQPNEGTVKPGANRKKEQSGHDSSHQPINSVGEVDLENTPALAAKEIVSPATR